LPITPSQKRLNWLADYIDLKKDALYDSIFAYQLIDAYLRGLIFWKTKNHKSADKFGFKPTVRKFVNCYPRKQNLGDRLEAWAVKRDIIAHRLLVSTRVTNTRKLDRLIRKIGDDGQNLFLELKNVKYK